ncbi:MAG TPA: tetratricopeptide repeat protein [Pyrinomonadaceae bacterium]|nr:tetratricopeptide repeat protein [Pyrinomonadaceae bacterium]
MTNKDRLPNTFYEFGPFRLDVSERILRRGNEPMTLTPKLFDTLLVLVERSGHIVEKSDLLEAVWPDTFVEESNLSSNVSLLRKALGEAEGGRPYIETIPKRGYRFADVVRELTPDYGGDDVIVSRHVRERVVAREEIEIGDGDEVASLAGPPFSAIDVSSARAIGAGRRSGPGTNALILGVLIILAAGGVIYMFVYPGRREPPARSAEVKSLAVLPFKLLGGGAGDEHLGLGIADALITKFSNTRHITVRPTSAMRKFDIGEQNAATAGRELGVEAVLEGTIQRAGDRLRLTVQLVRAQDGTPLWAEKFDAKFSDVFAMQDSISEQVATALMLKLTSEERQRLAKRYTSNAAAYEAYLRGRYFWSKRTPDAYKKAIEYFGQAISIDPTYALAYAGLADCYQILPPYGSVPPDARAKARSAALKALQLDDNLAEAHASMGVIKHAFDWDFAGAEVEFKRAIDLNPNYPLARLWYAQHLAHLGKREESFAEARRARELDPLSMVIWSESGWVYYIAGEHDQAVTLLNKALEIDPDFARAHYILAITLGESGKLEEQMAALRKMTALSGGDPKEFDRAMAPTLEAFRVGGAKAAWRKSAATLAERIKQNLTSARVVGTHYARAGDKDDAFFWLEKSYEERDPGLVMLKAAPDFASLRSDSRYTDLLRRIGFPE